MGLQLLEGRVQHDGVETSRRRHAVMKGRGVEPGPCTLRKQSVQKVGPRRRQFVEVQPGARQFGYDCQHACAGRRFQHRVARSDLSRQDRQRRDLGRRRELVERDLFLAARGVGKAQARECRHRRNGFERRILQAGDLIGHFAKVKDLGGFLSVIGVFPRPQAL